MRYRLDVGASALGRLMRINLATSADDNFALPATVMMRSVVDHLSGTQPIDFFVLDCGLTDRSRRKMRRSISRVWAKVHFVPIDLNVFTGFRVDQHIPAAAYARLLMGTCLPSTVERVLYLDGDMVALSDVQPLWDADFKGYPIAAVQDPVAGLVGHSVEMMHWQGWDVPEGIQYFNSGLMVMDLCRLRAEGTLEAAIEVARKYPERMKWHDQDALNYVLRGGFLPLDPAWNVLPFVHYPPHCHDVVYDPEVVARCIREPKILHFGGTWRPWKGPGRHWREAEFYRYLYRTAWRNDVYCAPWIGRGNTRRTRIKRQIKHFCDGHISGKRQPEMRL